MRLLLLWTRLNFWILFLFLMNPSLLLGQGNVANLEAQIDSLFSTYNEKPGPGIAIGIMLDGEVLLSKGYGLANLEHSIPISKTTAFDIGSVSKQFTAYAIAQLEKEGKLSYKDDIRKYLPDLHDFGNIITIDNLLFHSSGIRGSGILRGYIEGSMEVGKTIRQEDQLNIIYNQRELNFRPGTEAVYSNSGYQLLGEIVENVSNMSLEDFLRKNIFEPLNMESTLLAGSFERIIPNRAEPYKFEDGRTLRAEGMLWEDYGHSGIYSTVEDLFKWQRHIHKEDYMLRVDPNSSPVFAMGLMLMQDQVGEINEIFHLGSVPGYKTVVKYYPKLNLDVIALSNVDNSRTDIVAIESIKDLFASEVVNEPASEDIRVPLDYLQQFEGTYNIMGDNSLIAVEGSNLMAQTPMGKIKLNPIGPNEFLMEGSDTKMIFDESMEFFTLKVPGGEMKASRVEEVESASNYGSSLKVFVGVFESEELNIKNKIEVENDQLVVITASNQKIQLERTGEKTFEGVDSYYYAMVVFEAGNDGVPLNFRVSDEGAWVQNLLFKRIME